MANPNLLSLSTVAAATTYIGVGTSEADTVLLSNAAASGKVLKVISIGIANTAPSGSVDCTVKTWDTASGAGSSYPIITTVPVPNSSQFVVCDKDTPLFLTENQSIRAITNVANDATFIVSYETIS